MANHGVYVSEQATSVSTPVVADSGVPFVVGAAPVQSAATPAAAGVPVLCTSWAEAVEKLGYSEDWGSYPLCEFMYSHFQLFGCQPVIMCNVLDVADMKEAVAAADVAVSDHKAKLPIAAIDDENLVVKPAGGAGEAYVKDTDYSTYYDGEFLVIEVLSDGKAYSVEQVNVAYNKVKPDSVDDTAVATGMESIEQCLTTLGIVPDLICAPGHSQSSVVAAVMATKAGGINGMFQAKALIDIDSSSAGATSYTTAITEKSGNNFVDVDEVTCWPMLKLGDYKFHMSTQLAGLIAQVDTGNGGCPYESPRNKNFMGGWCAWGNYTACYPSNTDVKDYFIPVSRMFGWVGNTLIQTFWSKLDKPMNRRLIDTIMDTANIWLNGLVGSGYLLGARAEMVDSENPLTDLMAGIIKIHIYMTPPSPAQEIDFILEYDTSYVTSALQA